MSAFYCIGTHRSERSALGHASVAVLQRNGSVRPHRVGNPAVDIAMHLSAGTLVLMPVLPLSEVQQAQAVDA